MNKYDAHHFTEIQDLRSTHDKDLPLSNNDTADYFSVLDILINITFDY